MPASSFLLQFWPSFVLYTHSLRWLSLLTTFINKCWVPPHQSKPRCVYACPLYEKLSVRSPRHLGEEGRGRDPKHLNFTVRTSTQGGQISTCFQLSLGDLHSCPQMTEIKLIIISLNTRPVPSPFSNCKWGPRENDPFPILLSPKYHQVT